MARYEPTVDQELVHGLFRGDESLARLLEEAVNQVLESQALSTLRPVFTSVQTAGGVIGMATGRECSEQGSWRSCWETVSRQILDGALSDYSARAPRATWCLEQGFDDATVVMAYPGA